MAKAKITQDFSVVYSLKAQSSHCGVTPNTLKRIFKQKFRQSIASISPPQARAEKAKELLRANSNILQMIA